MEYRFGAFGAMAIVLATCAFAGDGGQKWTSSTDRHKGAAIETIKGMPKCADNGFAVMKIVCETPDLASLDLLTERLYQADLEQALSDKEHAALVAEHLRWQSSERDRCSTAACLKSAYQSRLRTLGFTIE